MFLDMYHGNTVVYLEQYHVFGHVHDNTVIFWTYYSKYHNFCTCTTAILQYFGQVTMEIPCFWTCTMVLAWYCWSNVLLYILINITLHIKVPLYYPTDIITLPWYCHSNQLSINQSYQSINQSWRCIRSQTREKLSRPTTILLLLLFIIMGGLIHVINMHSSSSLL